MVKVRYFGAFAHIKIEASSKEIAIALADCKHVVDISIANSPFGKPESVEYKDHVYPLLNFKAVSRRVAVSAFASYEYSA